MNIHKYLKPGDTLLKCGKCKQDFIFSIFEQKTYKNMNWYRPSYCQKCRWLRQRGLL